MKALETANSMDNTREGRRGEAAELECVEVVFGASVVGVAISAMVDMAELVEVEAPIEARVWLYRIALVTGALELSEFW